MGNMAAGRAARSLVFKLATAATAASTGAEAAAMAAEGDTTEADDEAAQLLAAGAAQG